MNIKHLEDINGIEMKKFKDMLKKKRALELELEELNDKLLGTKSKINNAISDVKKDEVEVGDIQGVITEKEGRLGEQKENIDKMEGEIRKVNFSKDLVGAENIELSGLLSKLAVE